MAVEANVAVRPRKKVTATPEKQQTFCFHPAPGMFCHVKRNTNNGVSRIGVSHWKNAVSATDNWFLNTISLICNLVTALCNIEIQKEKVT